MPSSTFSSNQRLPGGPGRWTWIGAIVLVALALTTWEAFWRMAGVRASARDPAAYVVARSQVHPTSTVLLGTSKMQSDVDPRVWARTLGEPLPIDLAVAGSSSLPLLEMLAENNEFRGTVVMEIMPQVVFASTYTRERAIVALEADYRKAEDSPAEWVEARLNLVVSSAFVFRRSGLLVSDAIKSLRSRRPPPVPDFRMTRGRFLPLVFSPGGIRERIEGTLRRTRQGDPPADSILLETIITRLERATAAVQGRGGRVVFVVLPSSGALRDLHEERYPRARYWERLVARTSALTLHTDDYPTLRSFDCPDGSHIEEPDTPRFTQTLALVIQQRLRERPPAGN